MVLFTIQSFSSPQKIGLNHVGIAKTKRTKAAWIMLCLWYSTDKAMMLRANLGKIFV